MYTHPGTKLLFQGGEFGQTSEWNFQGSLDWHLLEYDVHKGAQELVKDLNIFYKNEPALYQKQFSYHGFEWIDHGDHLNSVLSYIRKGENEAENIIVVLNLTPVPREKYRIGLPKAGNLKMVFNSDAKKYYGTDNYKNTNLKSEELTWNNRENSIELNLPPLGMLAFKYKK
tara:strand:- start:147 stop:659 length:513 start_codon:yes stop_codon:yes gene_type:complete